MIVLGEVSLIPAETGLPGSLGRKLRKVLFFPHCADPEYMVLSSHKRNLKNESN